MKITIDIDCTPQEARTFLGLPNIEPIQGVVLERLEERMKEGLAAMEPEALFRTWLPAGLQGVEHLQKMMLAQLALAAGKGDTDT